MKSGFVLLEILIAIALGAMIGAAIFTSFFQVNRAYNMAEQVIAFDDRAVLVQHQIERDVSGAFIPYIFLSQRETTTTTHETVTTPTKIKTTETTEKEKKKKEGPLEKAFYAEQRDGNLGLLSCVTSNPLPSYDSAKPRVARVTYQLVPEQMRGQKPSYRLFRDEQENISFVQPQAESPGRYELVRGIKSMTVQYRARPPKEKEKKGDKKQSSLQGAQEKKTQEELPPYETFSVWGKEQIEKVKRNLPHFVDVTISFWGRAQKRARSFTFKTAIIADDIKPKKIRKTPPRIQKNIKAKGGRRASGNVWVGSRIRR